MGRKTPKYELPDAVLAQSFEERVKWAIWAAQLREVRRGAAHVLLIMAAEPGQTQEEIGFILGQSQSRVSEAQITLQKASLLKVREGNAVSDHARMR